MRNLAVDFTVYFGEHYLSFGIWPFRWGFEFKDGLVNGQFLFGPFELDWL